MKERNINDITQEIDQVFEYLKKNKSNLEPFNLKKQLQDIWNKINIIIVKDYTLN